MVLGVHEHHVDDGMVARSLLGKKLGLHVMGLERGLLPDVAQRRGNTGHGRQRHRRRHGEAGHRASNTGKLAQIAGAVLVVDRADRQEQRGLEHRVGKKHGQPGQRDRALAVTDQHHDQAEL